MNLYKIGKVMSIGKTYIILESNYTGTIIHVPNTKLFKKDKVLKVYIYEHKNEYTEQIYGFINFKERVLFENLLKVQGVGPKTSLGLLVNGPDQLIKYILDGNASKIASMPFIGLKTANQIIFQLKDQYKDIKIEKKFQIAPAEISSSLKILGFTKNQIEYAIKHLEPANDIEVLVERAIKLISHANTITAK